MTNFEKVGIFMKTFGQDVKTTSELAEEKINKLRVSLIEEELDELKAAIKDNDIKEVADALTDILYVTYGAGHAFVVDGYDGDYFHINWGWSGIYNGWYL